MTIETTDDTLALYGAATLKLAEALGVLAMTAGYAENLRMLDGMGFQSALHLTHRLVTEASAELRQLPIGKVAQ